MYKLNIKEKETSKGCSYWSILLDKINNEQTKRSIYLCDTENQKTKFYGGEFTQKQFEICHLIIKKTKSKDIAASLNITKKKAEAKVLAIKEKFGMQTKKDLSDLLQNSNFRSLYDKHKNK